MITQFIEATQPEHLNYGKFMVARLDPQEGKTNTAMPGYEDKRLWTHGGMRAMRPGVTLVMDLQTGEGASFSLLPLPGSNLKANARAAAHAELAKHKVWVCPMFEPFLAWLFEQRLDNFDPYAIATLPRYVEIEAEFAFAGHRRRGPVKSADPPRIF